MATFENLVRVLADLGLPDGPAAVCKVQLMKVEKQVDNQWFWHPGKREDGERERMWGVPEFGEYRPTPKYTLHFAAVMGGGENRRFWEASPSFQCVFTTINEAAALSFAIGKEYYLPFVLADTSGPDLPKTV